MQRRNLLLTLLVLPLFFVPDVSGATSWIITLEEPTGIYRRDNEVVTVRLQFGPGEARPGRLSVEDPAGKQVPSQVVINSSHPDGSIKSADLLFRATIVPGERPQFRLITEPPKESVNALTARRLGISRVELANERFGVVVNLGLEDTEPALVSAFNKTAGPQRMLNLIDTSPDVAEALQYGRKSAGFGTFRPGSRRTGPFTKVEILENGPLRAHVRLSGAGLSGRGDASKEYWDFIWTSGSPVLHWRANAGHRAQGDEYGYFFSSVSASPYLPFDRWMEGSEAVKFPDGWEIGSPPDHAIGAQDRRDLPGHHVVYYQKAENYGALGIFAIDDRLQWHGVGSRQFYAIAGMSSGELEIETALAFPQWKGPETVLEARAEYRKYREPILAVISLEPVNSRKQVSGIRFDGSAVKSGRPDRTFRRNASRVARTKARPDKAGTSFREASLDGEWKLNWAEKSDGERQGFQQPNFNDSGWRNVSVPGTVHTQVLPSPDYYSTKANWISTKEWWYRRSFRSPSPTPLKRLRLIFDATDYYADIYLNGQLLGRHEGYIDPYEFDVTTSLKADTENLIAVRVWTPVSYYWRHRPYTIKGSYGAVDQKPDDITPLGITRSVRLVASGPAIISDLAVDPRLNRDGSADLFVDVEVQAPAKQELQIELGLSPRNFTGPSIAKAGSVITGGTTKLDRIVIHVEKPELWWTWDHGKPNLYTLEVKVRSANGVSDTKRLAVGIREIEKVDWNFYLNGRRMFIRGTNSYYNLFLSEMRRADYARDLEMIQRMNINMIRLHCHFSNREFYELCDEMGILIWQDFLEAWYPEDRTFSLKAAGLYDPHIRYVRNHPSVALWATSDEESVENYRDLTKHLEPRLYVNDPQRRPVVRSTGRYGDAHVYQGWYEGTIWAYARMSEKFVSELGATALPNYESLVKFLPNHWPIKDHEDDWVFHKLQITEAMRAWGEPGSMTLKEYIPQTQEYVARLFQLAIERTRRIKYAPAGGILHFHAIDLWPSVTMAAIDYYRQPTMAYQTVQKSFQMVLPSFAYDRDTWQPGETVRTELWLINDNWYSIPGATVEWRLTNSAGEVVRRGDFPRLLLAEDSSMRLAEVSFEAGPPGRYRLSATVADKDGKVISENDYVFTVK